MAVELYQPRSPRASAPETAVSWLASRPDLAFAARPLFLRLTETLKQSAELLAECRRMEECSTRHARTWGVPQLFFADGAAQRDWQSKQIPQQEFPEPFLSLLASARPKLTEAWNRLPDLLDDALSLMAESIAVRRMAKAVSGLRSAALAVPQARELAGILAMPEEEVLLVIHPAARTGYRLMLEGVADLAQLHVLLADRLTGDASRGFLPGTRPSFEALDACRDSIPNEGVVATSRYQFYRPAALRPDGRLPDGFAGSDSWYWGGESLAELPQEEGERILLIGDPVMPTTWEVSRRFSRIPARVDMLEVLPRDAVEDWLRSRCPEFAIRREQRARAA